ncbi:hypothetical protein JCM17845_28850 [Iodidimonas gelatinilytica]|uniref:Uncharacterized protein n=1 Tax=Iodidimonas gelatinilytica TaxID=1236966 RepID=A0A5A7N1V8_9PROT|nr:hypothetical protein JCM17845_28850 [Iodidimonas gelatinilytica]
MSSEHVRRGFRSICGSFLFWDPIEKDRIAVAMGALDGATGICRCRRDGKREQSKEHPFRTHNQ